MGKFRQAFNSFKEIHYFVSGLALGIVLGIIIEKVL